MELTTYYKKRSIVYLLWSMVVAWLLVISHGSVALENPDQKIAEVIKDYVVAKYPDFSKGEIKVTFKYAENTFVKLQNLEEVSLKIIELYRDFKPLGNLILPLEVKAKGNFLERIILQAKIEVYKDVVVAVETIKKRKVLTENDLKMEKRDIALLPQKYTTSFSEVIGKESKMTIPKKSMIFSWMVGELPVIRRGEEVEIAVSSTNLLVQTKGIALENGYPGEFIKVKREGAKKVIQGVVTAPGKVEVKL